MSYSVSTLSCHFIINSCVDFAVCEVQNFSPAWHKKHKVVGVSMLSQALTKAAGRARMQKMWKVCHSKCMALFISVLSHASVIPNFKYWKLLHAHNLSKQVPWQLYVKQLSYSRLHANSTWMHYSSCTPLNLWEELQEWLKHKPGEWIGVYCSTPASIWWLWDTFLPFPITFE